MTIPVDTTPNLMEWPELQRQRRAIVVVDVVESVRLMQANEAHVIDRWRRFVNQVRTQVLPAHGGRLVKSLGDGLLLEFESVQAASSASLEMHRRIARLSDHLSDPLTTMVLRIGMHVAEVVVDALDIYGHGVNLAARLAALAGPGQCAVSSEVRSELVDGLDARIEDLGECFLKGMERPVRAYRLGEVNLPSAAEAMNARPVQDIRPTIAVLPIAETSSTASTGGVVGDVLADDISAALSRCPELQVVSRLSTAAFRGREIQPAQLALLRANYLVSGSCLIVQDTARVRLELSDSATGHVLWAEAANVGVGALMLGQESGVALLVSGIGAAVLAREVRAATSLPLPNVESHALMSAAIALMHRSSRLHLDRARSMLEHLTARHHRLPQPHAWLAKWHVLRVVQGWSADPSLDGQQALDSGNRALDGDPQSSLALTMQGLVHAYLLRDFDQAHRLYAEALRTNPSEAMALLLLGTMHAFLGDGEPAWRLTQASLALTPLDPLRYFYLSLSASAAIAAERYDDAIHLAQRSLDANRTHMSTHRALALAQALGGREDDARRTVSAMLELEPGFTVGAFRQRYPGRDAAPAYTERLAAAFLSAGLPE